VALVDAVLRKSTNHKLVLNKGLSSNRISKIVFIAPPKNTTHSPLPRQLCEALPLTGSGSILTVVPPSSFELTWRADVSELWESKGHGGF
jgi:hypothetical protein